MEIKMPCNFQTASGFYPWQTTIKKEISTSGIGLHKGDKIDITLKPSEANLGIRFIRTDLDHELTKRTILANYKNVSDTNMCTTIENEYGIEENRKSPKIGDFPIQKT